MATAEFSKFADLLSAAFQQYHLLGYEIVQLEFHYFVRSDASQVPPDLTLWDVRLQVSDHNIMAICVIKIFFV